MPPRCFSSDGVSQLPDACRFDHLPDADPDIKVNEHVLITDSEGGNASTFKHNDTTGWHCLDNYCVSKLLRTSAGNALIDGGANGGIAGTLDMR